MGIMKPIEFPGFNTTFAKDQPEYQPLPAYVGPNGEVVSCWELTMRERIQVLETGRLYLTQLTFGQPLQPQLPSLEKPLME